MIEKPLCLSGGAEGADLQWGMTAGAAGHQVIHWGFSGHKSKAPKEEIVLLSKEQLLVADEYLKSASVILKRYYPAKSEYVCNLLRRNYYQIAWSESFYGVAKIDSTGLVEGGTGWAWAMFSQLHPNKDCWLFCQKENKWFQFKDQIWIQKDPNIPTNIWTGVGSRELTQEGKQAIRALMNWSNKNPS